MRTARRRRAAGDLPAADFFFGFGVTRQSFAVRSRPYGAKFRLHFSADGTETKQRRAAIAFWNADGLDIVHLRKIALKKKLKTRLTKIAAAVVFFGLSVAGTYAVARWGHHYYVEQRVGHYWPTVQKYARAANLPPELVRSVIRCESGGDPEAHSKADARGLMQITPQTQQEVCRRVGLSEGDLYNADYNILVGTCYLRQLLDRFDGDALLAVAAYHMGPSRVAQLRVEHPQLSSQELVGQYAGPATRAYCARVLPAR